jgi:serine/threonine-protein kinase RsbT
MSGSPVIGDEPQTIPIRGDADIVTARGRVREVIGPLPFSRGDVAMVATAVSELARNILVYADEGEITVQLVQKGSRRGVCVVARDHGPGIADIEVALRDGYSTSGSLGLGLPGSRRLMDEFEIESAPGAGTTVSITKWAPHR